MYTGKAYFDSLNQGDCEISNLQDTMWISKSETILPTKVRILVSWKLNDNVFTYSEGIMAVASMNMRLSLDEQEGAF